MNAEATLPLLIAKENITRLKFPPNEVLSSPDDIKQRKNHAETGLLLGNDYKCKVKILFEDSESVKQVETTIWGLTDMHVILKCGINIPLQRIYRIYI